MRRFTKISCISLFKQLLILILATWSIAAFPKGKAHTKTPKRIKVSPLSKKSGEFTFTQESNLYRRAIYLNTIIDYATPNGWVFGLQLLNIPAYGVDAQPFQYDAYITLSKAFRINDSWSVAIGTHNGSVLFNTSSRHLHSFTFLDNQFITNAWFNFHLGAFYVNDALATIHEPYGVMTGFEVRIIPRVLHFQNDFFAGRSNISGNIANLLYYPASNWQLYAGVNVPTPHTGNVFSGNIGVAFKW